VQMNIGHTHRTAVVTKIKHDTNKYGLRQL